MNKYQEFAIKLLKISLNEIEGSNVPASLEWDSKKIIIEQNENYCLTDYEILLHHVCFEKVEYLLNSKMINAEKINEDTFKIILSFESKIENIKIYFVNNLIDPVVIPVEFIDADKQKYDDKIAAENKMNLDKLAKVKVTTGDSLINITFQPVSNQYSYSKVELYTNEKQLMGKFKTDEDMFFKSITGLAYGVYYTRLVQYNKKDEELYLSDYILVMISKPNYYNKPCNVH